MFAVDMPEPAKLLVDGNTLVYCRDDEEVAWTLPIPCLVLIAEYTTDQGPWLDDWWLVFWTLEETRLLQAWCPVPANASLALIELSRQLEADAELGLMNSTEWESRVMWPHKLVNEQYFTFRSAKGRNLVENAWLQLLGTHEYQLSDRVRLFLDGTAEQNSSHGR